MARGETDSRRKLEFGGHQVYDITAIKTLTLQRLSGAPNIERITGDHRPRRLYPSSCYRTQTFEQCLVVVHFPLLIMS